jgi:hypothetical protein
VQLHTQYSALAEAWGVLSIQCPGMVLIQKPGRQLEHIKHQTLPNAFPPASEVFSGRTFLSAHNPAARAAVRPTPDRSSDMQIACRCPACGRNVPHMGALFWKHLYACDRDVFHGVVGAAPPSAAEDVGLTPETPAATPDAPPPATHAASTPQQQLRRQRWQRGREFRGQLPEKRPHPDSGVAHAQAEARKRLNRHERHLRCVLDRDALFTPATAAEQQRQHHGEHHQEEKAEKTQKAAKKEEKGEQEQEQEQEMTYLTGTREQTIRRVAAQLGVVEEQLARMAKPRDHTRLAEFSKRWNLLMRCENTYASVADFKQRFPECIETAASAPIAPETAQELAAPPVFIAL